MQLDLNITFSVLMTAALAVIGYLIKVLFNLVIKRIQTVEEENDNIKTNYISKFTETNKNIQDLGEKITKKFDENIKHLSGKIENNYVTKEFCQLIHRKEL